MPLIVYFELAGIALVAASGTLVASKKGVDLFGGIVFAIATGVGGGTLRDVLIDVPVFWIESPSYLLVAAVSGFVTFFWVRIRAVSHRAIVISDAFALALFAIMGCSKTLEFGFSPIVAVTMGTVTAIAGGIIRDLLANDIPLVFRGQIYASAAIAGSTVFTICHAANLETWVSATAGSAVVLSLRLAAIRWNIILPHALATGKDPSETPEGTP